MKYKTLGLIGGIGPESTVDYYKMIIKKFRERISTNDYPFFLINNINMTEMLSYIYANQYDALVEFLSKEIKKIKDAGADFGALASNTPHIVFNELQKKITLPMISIVEETFKTIQKQGLKKVGLFGTLSTMDAGFYQKAGKNYSIEVVTPERTDKEFINQKYFGELVAGIINKQTKKELISMANMMKDNYGIEGLILGGTELPLILSQDDFIVSSGKGIIVFNTSEIHVNSIIEKMLEPV